MSPLIKNEKKKMYFWNMLEKWAYFVKTVKGFKVVK